jgi:hypothetical protein
MHKLSIDITSTSALGRSFDPDNRKPIARNAILIFGEAYEAALYADSSNVQLINSPDNL